MQKTLGVLSFEVPDRPDSSLVSTEFCVCCLYSELLGKRSSNNHGFIINVQYGFNHECSNRGYRQNDV